jgi:hypothetical protein
MTISNSANIFCLIVILRLLIGLHIVIIIYASTATYLLLRC